jgi:uncharacterized membrane protein YdbT with pleckstrin-like domain
LRDEGEVVVDEVFKHWAVYLRPAVETVLALPVLVAAVYVPMAIAWVLLVVAAALGAHGAWSALTAYTDRFVITNMRVFRVRGVLAQRMATMPLGRILDITVHKPLTGRVLGYGHFVFESAAQEQGLRDIRFVGRPDERDLAIQRVVQRAGLRGGLRP